jgi:hypothetical protein
MKANFRKRVALLDHEGVYCRNFNKKDYKW